MQFQGKLKNQTRENNNNKKKLSLIVAPLAQIWAPKIFSCI